MPTTDGSHDKTLAALGVTQPEQLAFLFAEIRARFDSESGAVRDETAFKQFRDASHYHPADDHNFLSDIAKQPNVPEPVRTELAQLY